MEKTKPNHKMRKDSIHISMIKVIPQMILQSVLIILVSFASSFLMTWIIEDMVRMEDMYQRTVYESLGTLIMTICILVPINTIAYHIRLKEVVTLSEHIKKVADGDFSTRIIINPKDQIAVVYENFNKMCAELQSVQILRNDFINNYSHEFKTPIASINGFASLLIEKECSSEQQEEYLKIIRDESERLSNLAKNTILLSKLSSQQMITSQEEYNLGEQLRQCAIILSPEWMKKKITFDGDFSNIKYRGNKELMQHLWLNIIGNSVKYTPNGGDITAKLIQKKDVIEVIVKDSGEGMTEEVLEHLFDPYYQGDTSHASKGLGLGLAIAKRIVELCNGTISVKSELGVGSQFMITLPIK